MSEDFLDVYTKIITLTPFTTTGSGTHVPGTPHSYHAHISADAKAVYSATGQTVFSTSVVIFHPRSLDNVVLTAATPDMDLKLPDGTHPRILTIGSLDDELGIVAYECRT